LEGVQDQGGEHGGQAGMPKVPPRPKTTKRDQDVLQKGETDGSKKLERRRVAAPFAWRLMPKKSG
jgi:hypothetical protein